MSETAENRPQRPARQEPSPPIAAKDDVIRRCPKSSLVLEHESNVPNGRAVWYSRVPSEHTIEDALSPNYYGALQIQHGGLRPGDIIDIEPEHGLWGTRVRVMALAPSIQQVKTREIPNFRQSYAVKPPAGYRFDWRGGQAKWVIVKTDTNVDVQGGFDTQDEAALHIGELDRRAA